MAFDEKQREEGAVVAAAEIRLVLEQLVPTVRERHQRVAAADAVVGSVEKQKEEDDEELVVAVACRHSLE